MKSKLVTLLFLIPSGFNCAQTTLSPFQIYQSMITAMGKVQNATFGLKMQERIYGTFVYSQYEVKLCQKPYKIYLKCIKPDAGAEVLFKENYNEGKALVSPHRFPYFTISLDPEGSLIRKHHHFTLLQTGFEYARTILMFYERNNKNLFLEKIKPYNRKGFENLLGIMVDNDQFGYMNYKVKQGENITSIARKFAINDQMILEANDAIHSFDDVEAGQVISIPNTFARKIIFFIDPKTMLPVRQEMYDDKGLYNASDFSNINLNPTFDENTFSPDNKNYGF